jgi:hypothetical protein
MRQVVQLVERRLAPVALTVLLDRVTRARKLRRDAARHVGLDSLTVALELVDHELRDQQSHATFVGENADGDNQLLPVDVLG